MPWTPGYTRRKSRSPLTAADLRHVSIPNKRTELVLGTLVVRELPGARHGYVAARICRVLVNYVDEHDFGAVFAADTGFKLFADPDTVRAPDVAFVSKARMPIPLPVGYATVAPDLAVEVLSPDDRPGDVLAKAGDWLMAGSALVWVIDPQRRSARVFRADGTESAVGGDQDLAGEGVLPGFSCPLASVIA